MRIARTLALALALGLTSCDIPLVPVLHPGKAVAAEPVAVRDSLKCHGHKASFDV